MSDARLRRVATFCAVHGFFFVSIGILSGIGISVAGFLGKLPPNAGAAPLWAGILGSFVVVLFGLPGVLAFLLRKDRRAGRFVIAAGVILVLHIFLLPGFLPGPVVMPLFVLALASAGVWVLLTTYAVKREAQGGESE